MEFNSNDEYLKAFPPNFGPRIEGPSKEELFDLQAHGLPSKDPQGKDEIKPVEEPALVCLDDELECVEVQEPVQVEAEKAESYGDVLREEQEENLILGEDLAPEIDEPMPQMADMALLRDEEMVIDDADGGALKTMLSLEAIEDSILDSELLEVKGQKDLAEKSVMEDEEPNLKEFIRSTRYFRPVTVEGNVMESKALNNVKIEVIESTLITAETPEQIEFVDSAIRALEEASEYADAIEHVNIKEPVTLEVTEKTTLITTPVNETKESTTAIEIIEKTTIKAKAICQEEEEEPRITVKFNESTITTVTGLDKELGTSSETDVDRIINSIMNDIAGIEADIEDAGFESNTQHQKVTPTFEKPVGIECGELTCQEHVGPS